MSSTAWQPWAAGAAASSTTHRPPVRHAQDAHADQQRVRLDLGRLAWSRSPPKASPALIYKGLDPALATTDHQQAALAFRCADCAKSSARNANAERDAARSSRSTTSTPGSSARSLRRSSRRCATAAAALVRRDADRPRRAPSSMTCPSARASSPRAAAARRCGLVLPLIFTRGARQGAAPGDARRRGDELGARARRVAGGVAALYAGHRFTVARSTLGNASLFGAFEAWKALLRSPLWPGGDMYLRRAVLSG